MKLILFAVFLIIGSVFADTDSTNSLYSNIPGLSNFPLSDISEESGKQFFKDKCKNQTNDDKVFDKILEARDTFQNFIQGQFNFTEIQQEIEDAKPTGDLDVVFGKYCRKIPNVIEHIKDFYKSLKPCLTQPEQDGAKIAFNVTQSMYEFLCYRDGDRIALFIAEKGVECISSKQQEIQNCANKTIGTNLITELPKFEDQCIMLGKLQTCVVTDLEKCKEPTPANLIDALFKYVRKIISCPKKN